MISKLKANLDFQIESQPELHQYNRMLFASMSEFLLLNPSILGPTVFDNNGIISYQRKLGVSDSTVYSLNFSLTAGTHILFHTVPLDTHRMIPTVTTSQHPAQVKTNSFHVAF